MQSLVKEEGYFTLYIDAAMDMEYTYTFDGTVDNNDHLDIYRYISVRCTKSNFFAQIFGESAGVCTAEIIFVDDEYYIGVVTAEGTARFDEHGISSILKITRGDGHCLGEIGSVYLDHESMHFTHG